MDTELRMAPQKTRWRERSEYKIRCVKRQKCNVENLSNSNNIVQGKTILNLPMKEVVRMKSSDRELLFLKEGR